jgi:isovaleryl-CoA dehydrogenase
MPDVAPTMNFLLGENADAIREATARFAAERIAPQAAAIDESNRFPRELWPEMGALGLHGITVEEEFGGLGLGYLEHAVAMEEVSRASASVGLSYGAHSQLCVNQIRRWGTAEQKARYLPKLISGEHVGALAMSEAGAGSDVMSMTLRADRRGNDRYALNGTKFWITNGPEADVLVVYAKTDPGAGSKGVTAFIVERGFSGYRCAQKLDKMGMRGSDTGELVFQDCEVPAENALGEPGSGARVLMSGLDYERAVLAAGPLGIMQACLDVVLPYVRERRQFGQPIGAFQLIQAKVADMYLALNSARAYVYAVARACDAGHAARHDAAGAILLASENAVQTALESIQALGGAGYLKDFPVERFLRDAKLYDIGAGTNEIRRFLMGRELIGL